MGVDNPGEHQHIDGGRLGAQQRPRARIDGRARGQDIVDQDDARCDLDRPICCWVGRTRRSASVVTFTPLCRSMMRASAPDWL